MEKKIRKLVGSQRNKIKNKNKNKILNKGTALVVGPIYMYVHKTGCVKTGHVEWNKGHIYMYILLCTQHVLV